MRRRLLGVGGLAAVQVFLVAGYFAVEAVRAPEAPFAAEALDEPAPALEVERRGRAVSLVDLRGEPVLVHFWATWCVPCRKELPGLLEAAEEEGVELLAVTDEPWPVVERFFEEDPSDAVVRDASGEAGRRWRVSALPDTYVVDADGRVRARIGGARDWRTSSARAFLRALREGHR